MKLATWSGIFILIMSVIIKLREVFVKKINKHTDIKAYKDKLITLF